MPIDISCNIVYENAFYLDAELEVQITNDMYEYIDIGVFQEASNSLSDDYQIHLKNPDKDSQVGVIL